VALTVDVPKFIRSDSGSHKNAATKHHQPAIAEHRILQSRFVFGAPSSLLKNSIYQAFRSDFWSVTEL
jgi:hypothetical protein